jgi:HEAT repeat protein/thiol-disulfide isomerase/thioredoxin
MKAAGLSAMLLAIALPTFQTSAAEPAAPVTHPTLKSASEAAAADQSLVLLVFSASWCGPCKMLKSQTLDSTDFLERAGGLHIADVDVDADPQTSRAFDVSSIPALFLLTGDGKIVARQVGFVSALDLIQWIEKARVRAKAGQWEGTAPGAKFDEFIKKSEGEGLNTNDLQRLVALLGDADPADRSAAVPLVLAQRELAVPVLIAAVGDSYLGTRISASDLLQQLAPEAPVSDPWQSPLELSNNIVALEKWWAGNGKLPPSRATRLDAVGENSIKELIDEIRGDNPSQRTDAMAGLARQGASALPMIRDAIRKSEHSGDQRSLSLLEDVRWAVLVPDALEQQSGGVRSALARGKSSERQTAAGQLGHAGRSGLNALTELLNDSDPLVVESAVRAVSGVGGKDAIPALAALLQAGDSNLRMTAAQALGHTKNPDAIKPLLSAFIDPNEVVACTALGAVEEIHSGGARSSSSKEPLPKDATTALQTSLGDSRWRVRATAAEIIGKMGVSDLSADVKKLLEDPDGFVVKNAMAALSTLGAAPDTVQLVALGKRLPGLRTATIEMMLQNDSEETAKTVTEMFNAGGIEEQLSILNAMAQNERSSERNQMKDDWKPLFTRATTATDSRLRRAAASILSRTPPKLAAELVGPLLTDDDPQTRAAAAGIVLGILIEKPDATSRFAGLGASSQAKTNKPVATPQQLATWHTAMQQHPDTNMDLTVAAAMFATGDGRTDLPLIEKTLGTPRSGKAQRAQNSAAVAVIVTKLSWPEGKAVLDKMCASPLLFAIAAGQSKRATPEVVNYLLEPPRFKNSLETASGEDLTDALEQLAGYDSDNGWTFWIETDRTRAIDMAMVESTNAAWRATAVFSLGLRSDADNAAPVFEKAITDTNPWVRAAAVASLARHSKDRARLEQYVGPLVSDTNSHVAQVAACALLEPELRLASGLEQAIQYFQFEEHHGGRMESSTPEARPLTMLEGKPAFLQSARKWLSTKNETSEPFALLLAQYGEFDGLDQLVSRRAEASQQNHEIVLAGIALSHDSKYIPTLRQIMGKADGEWELRKVLQALKGMTGPEARQLRLDINKRLRDTGKIGASTFD